MKLELSIPTLAALLFGAFGALAVASLHPVLSRFALEAEIDEWIFIVAPALLAMLFALVVYRRAGDRVRNVGQSLSRGLLVAVLTWVGFAAISTWVWCVPTLYGDCFRQALMVTGVLGGGQLLLAALAAAAIVGYAIRRRDTQAQAAKG